MFTSSLLGLVLLHAFTVCTLAWLYLRLESFWRRQRHDARTVLAFFHPFCTSGGGGERVLCKMLQVLGELRVEADTPLRAVIYTIDPPSDTYKEGVFVCRRCFPSFLPRSAINNSQLSL